MAVLLAEIGGPLGHVARTRPYACVFVMTLLVTIAAGVGVSLAEAMVPAARQLMLGILLVLAATSQIWTGKPPKPTLPGTALALSRSSAPALVFGFAAWLGEPFTPALAVIGGAGLAAGAAVLGVDVPPVMRRIAGALLGAAGLIVAIMAFKNA